MKRKKLIIIPVSLAILSFFLILTENGKYFVRYAVLNFPDINDYSAASSGFRNSAEGSRVGVL